VIRERNVSSRRLGLKSANKDCGKGVSRRTPIGVGKGRTEMKSEAGDEINNPDSAVVLQIPFPSREGDLRNRTCYRVPWQK
jgi:hypothetical protein